MDWSGQVCAVTGGAGGIGRGIAEAFLERGARVAVLDLDAVAGQALAGRYSEERLLFLPGDVADRAALESFVQRLTRRFGPVRCLVNNACVSRGGLLSGCGYEDFDYALRAGLAAPYHLTRLLLPHFAPGAAVLNIASTRAGQSQPDTESYSAAKGGIVALTHAMSASLAGRVRVNAISPGWIETGGAGSAQSPPDRLQHPAGRVGRPEDIAALALFLLGDEAGFLTGQNIAVDGGMSKLMIYHDDHGWTYRPEREETP